MNLELFNPKQSLTDQMGISDREIARRLHFLDFTEVDVENLLSVQDLFEQKLPRVIEDYYAYQLSDPEIADIIGDVDTLDRLKAYMYSYIQLLFSGPYDGAYVNTRLRIGKVHKRLDVRPKLYMKAFAELQRLLEAALDEGEFVETALRAKASLRKILLFDAELVFDAYVESYVTEMQAATREVEKYATQVGIKLDSMFARMHERAQKDSVTGLHNRRAFYDFLKHECRIAERNHLSFVLAYIDLNNFKAVNDLHGHHVGDEVLEKVAQSLLSVTRSVDVPARYGGDEFCIIMPRTTLNEVTEPLRRLSRNFEERCSYPVTLSIGVVQVGPTHFEEPEELIQKADAMMYEAKQKAHRDGGHHWQFEGKEGSPDSV